MSQFMRVRATDPLWGMPLGVQDIRVHDESKCAGWTCVIHNPTDHHMRAWPALWRTDTQVLERTCSHGVGHPDPDQFAYWGTVNTNWRRTHGCDGCCKPVDET